MLPVKTANKNSILGSWSLLMVAVPQIFSIKYGLPNGYWNRDNRQANLDNVNPDNVNDNNGFRPSVRRFF